MPNTNTPALPLTEEEILGWETYDPRIRNFINPIWVELMAAASEEMKQYADHGSFSDDDTDYIRTTTDAIEIVTHLAYEGTKEDLAYFLFNTDLDADFDDRKPEGVHILSLAEIDSAGGAIHGCPSLHPFIERYHRIEEEKEDGRSVGELSRQA